MARVKVQPSLFGSTRAGHLVIGSQQNNWERPPAYAPPLPSTSESGHWDLPPWVFLIQAGSTKLDSWLRRPCGYLCFVVCGPGVLAPLMGRSF